MLATAKADSGLARAPSIACHAATGPIAKAILTCEVIAPMIER